MKKLFAAAFLAVMLSASVTTVPLLTGCALFGVKAENFSERLVSGYKSVETVADLVGALHTAGRISQADGNAALDRAEELKQGIDAAAAFRNVGDLANAESRLAASISALELLLAQLRARP